MDINRLTLHDLQPSQFYISEQKLLKVNAWFDPQDLSSFEPIPVKLLDDVPVMTDGHTRAAAALIKGIETVPLVWDEDDLDLGMYRRCVEECKRRNVLTAEDLLKHIIPEAEYQVKWNAWCDNMQADIWYERAVPFLKELFKDDHGGHNADHTFRVYRNAMEIASGEPGCDKVTVALIALLHDADDHKLFRTADNFNARTFLSSHNIGKDEADSICAAVNQISFSQNEGKAPNTLEAQIVQDADRLDAIGAIGIARTFAYGGVHQRSIEDSVRHFYDKLLLLKDLINTETAKKLAEERHTFLEVFLRELDKELGNRP